MGDDVISIDEENRILSLAKYERSLYEAIVQRKERTELLKVAIKICQIMLRIPEWDTAEEIARHRVNAIQKYEKAKDLEVIGEKELSEAYYKESQQNFRAYLLAIKNYLRDKKV